MRRIALKPNGFSVSMSFIALCLFGKKIVESRGIDPAALCFPQLKASCAFVTTRSNHAVGS